jgi:D-inositol-3-phosphate glycosyltransferase
MDKNVVFDSLPEFVGRIRRFAAESGLHYHYIHSHYWLSGWVGRLLSHTWDAPHVTTFHTLARVKNRALDAPAETERRGEIEQRIAAQADGIIVSSDHERHLLVDLYDATREKIHVVPPGVDLSLFRPVEKLAAKARLGLTGREVVFAVGRMDPVKGFDVLIRAVPLLRRHRSLRLILAGGPLGDGEHRRLTHLVASLGVEDRVSFVGPIRQADLPAYYSAADVVVVPSHYESFGFVAAEALACGTPVVASRVGGLPTVVHDGVNGLLVPWRKPEAFAERISLLLRDPDLRGRLAANARPSVEGIGWSAAAAKTIEIYRRVGSAREEPLVCCCGG